MDHFYQTIGENWFSYAEFYSDMVQRFYNARFLELGCWKGRSTAFLCVEIINQNKDIEVTCVDSWQYRENTEQPVCSQIEFDDVYKQFLENTKQFNNIKVIREDSVTAASGFPDNYFDVVFIDAGHHYVDVLQDLRAWNPKCKSIIAGHDYFTRVHPGVKQAVDEYFNYDVWCSPKNNVWMKIK